MRADNLPAKISRGWYVTGTWAITGESKENGINPRRKFISEGMGAIELALRYEQIAFRSAGASGLEFRSPRAPNIWPNSNRVWTLGVNWYLNKYSRIQVNGIRETLLGSERQTRFPAKEGCTRAWSGFSFRCNKYAPLFRYPLCPPSDDARGCSDSQRPVQ